MTEKPKEQKSATPDRFVIDPNKAKPTDLEDEIVKWMNETRAAEGLPPLQK